MKRTFVMWFFLVFTIGLSNVALSQDYFVAKNGDDSNIGTQDQPWLTIQKAANNVSAGDTVYIKAGTYTEIIEIKASGTDTSENEIKFHRYASDVVEVVGYFNLRGYDYIQFDGLTIKDSSYGFYENAGAPGSSYITIKNCTIQNTAAQGIYLRYGDHNTVQNTIVKQTGNTCIQGFGEYWLIENCDLSSPAIEDGIGLGHDPGNHIIRRNYIHDINGTGHVDAIQVVCGANTIIEYNIIENVRSEGIIIQTPIGSNCQSYCDGVIIRYNLIYNTQDFSQYYNSGYRIIITDGHDIEIVGNSIAYNYLGAMHIYASTWNARNPSGIIKNNMFYENNGRNIITTTNFAAGSIDYNSYYGSNQGTPAANNDSGTHSMNSAPQHLNDNNATSPGLTYSDILASSFLKIGSTSPVRDLGVSYSGMGWQGVDIARVSIPQSTGWSIGAYEYGSGPSPPKNLFIVSE